MNPNMTLQQLLKLPLFDDAELFTTEKGITNPLKSINIMDTLEIDEWLGQDELLVIGNFIKHYLTRD